MKKFGLLGYPLGHSLSPALHRLLAEQHTEKMEYTLFEVEPQEWEEKLTQMQDELDGFNVTIPYKMKVRERLDELDRSAKLHGAVNTVLKKDGKWIGYNTDCIGFVKSMEENQIPLKGSVCVLGAGGVGRMFATECVGRGCNVTLAVRKSSLSTAQKLREELVCALPQSEAAATEIETLKGSFDLLINATPCGMFPHIKEMPVNPEFLQNVTAVFDCIYNPQQTMLLAQAERMGCKTVNGLGMLCWQAAAAQEIWLDISFQEAQLHQVEKQLLAQRIEEK